MSCIITRPLDYSSHIFTFVHISRQSCALSETGCPAPCSFQNSFIYCPGCRLCFIYVCPQSMFYIVFYFIFSNLQALLIYLDAAHDLITRGVKDVRTLTGGGRRTGDQKLNLHKLFLFLCSCDTGLHSKCRGDKICQLSCRRV